MSDETPENRARRLHLERINADIGRMIGDAVERTAPGAGFCLMLFDFGGGGNLSYMCNAKREDMIKVLAEFRNKLRGE